MRIIGVCRVEAADFRARERVWTWVVSGCGRVRFVTFAVVFGTVVEARKVAVSILDFSCQWKVEAESRVRRARLRFSEGWVLVWRK